MIGLLIYSGIYLTVGPGIGGVVEGEKIDDTPGIVETKSDEKNIGGIGVVKTDTLVPPGGGDLIEPSEPELSDWEKTFEYDIPEGGEVVKDWKWSDLGMDAVEPVSAKNAESVTILVTHYNPRLGGLNCWRFVDGRCVSKTYSGVPWEYVEGISAACPWSWELFSTFIINDRAFICLDRGSMMCKDGICHVDILTEHVVDGVFPGFLFRREE